MVPSLRPWRETDFEDLSALGNNPRIARFMTDGFPSPYTLDKAKGFIAMSNSESPPRILAIALDDKAVGGIGIHLQSDIYSHNAELGYWLGEPFWGKGIMTEAIRKMVTYGFEQWPIDRIFARPFHTNIGSQRALEKAGFILEARLKGTIRKQDERLDELIYAIRR